MDQVQNKYGEAVAPHGPVCRVCNQRIDVTKGYLLFSNANVSLHCEDRLPVLRSYAARIVLFLSLTIMAAVIPATAQYPDAPQSVAKFHMDKQEKVLLWTSAGADAADFASTYAMLHNGDREVLLPGFVVDHPAVFVGVKIGKVLASYVVARELERMNHPTLAHVFTMIELGMTARWGIENSILASHPRQTMIPQPDLEKIHHD